jgi:hypothetical protein
MATSEVNRASGSVGLRVYIEDVSEPNVTPTPSAVTITGITAADPPVVTATAHGLTDGARVTITGVLGMTEINTLSSAIKVTAANTFELVELDSTDYTAYTSGGTATPSTFHDLCMKNFNLTPGTSADIDTTTMCDTAKTFIVGMRDNGTATGDINYDPCNLGILEAESAWDEATPRWFQVVFPLYPAAPGAAADTTNTVKEFQAYVQNVAWNTSVDAVIGGSIALRLTGPTITIGCGL